MTDIQLEEVRNRIRATEPPMALDLVTVLEKSRLVRRRRRLGTVAGVLLAAVVVGASLAVLTGAIGEDEAASPLASDPGAESSQFPSEFPTPLATSDFPTNAHGLTYGSDAEADSLAETPDLVGVTADNGAAGFVYKEDLAFVPYFEDPPNTPEPRILDVYEVEGQRVIGKFTVPIDQIQHP
ncbi:MAG: hypothetical protein Q8Q02_13905 [Nocardioides sp.]|nr:hypothetical protein [Nocardioides sp.]